MASPKAAPKRPPIVRMTGTFVGSPGTLGFANLLDPDEAFDQVKFKANVHHTDDQLKHFAARIDNVVIAPLWEDFLKAADDLGATKPRGGYVKPTGMEWIESVYKDPKESSRIQLPYIIFSNDADYKDRDGILQRREMRGVDGHNNKLDLRKARLGMGSTVQPLLGASIWASALSKGQAALSFKLQGVRVLHLVQFGGSGPGLEEVTEDDLGLVEEGFEAEDLSAYTKGAEASDDKPKASQRTNFTEDLDDEIPF